MATSISYITSSPKDSEYVPLAEHQASTPATFSLEENPVLHHKSIDATLTSSQSIGSIKSMDEIKSDIYVSSYELTIWLKDQSIGLNIPYRRITLHAIQMEPSPRLYLQIEPEEGDEEDFIEITITPNDRSTLRTFYKSLSDCASLHPDPEDSDDEMAAGGNDGGDENIDVGPWITADNFQDGGADDIGDEDFSYGEAAGIEVEMNDMPVHAGLRRTRDDEDNDTHDANNTATNNRTNVDENSKWRRTGS